MIKVLREIEFSYRKDAWSLNTITTYKTYIKKFNTFLVLINRPQYPALLDTICLFITALAKGNSSFSTILVAISAIRAVHILYAYDDPTKGDRVSLLLKGIRRNDIREKNKKAPITLEIMKKFWIACQDNLGLILWAGFSLAFAALLRKSELLALRWSDVSIEDGKILWVVIRTSKTDQFRETATIPLACICDKPWCPVHCVLRLFEVTQMGVYGIKAENSIIFDFSYIGFFRHMLINPCFCVWGRATHIT